MKSTSFPKKIDLVYTIIDEIDIIKKKIDSIKYKYICIYELNQNYAIVLLLLLYIFFIWMIENNPIVFF